MLSPLTAAATQTTAAKIITIAAAFKAASVFTVKSMCDFNINNKKLAKATIAAMVIPEIGNEVVPTIPTI